MSKDANSGTSGGMPITFRLFITGSAPNSLIAKERLAWLCREFSPDEYQIEIIDVLEDGSAAKEHGIFITPALMVVKEEFSTLLYGNLRSIDSFRGIIPSE